MCSMFVYLLSKALLKEFTAGNEVILRITGMFILHNRHQVDAIVEGLNPIH